MSKELFISTTPHETKVAIVEDEQLTEIYFERENEYTLAGSIYKGKVTRVLPGMQSAFVDIGLERDAFLYVTDFLDMEDQEDDLEQGIPKPSQSPRDDHDERPNRSERQERGGRGQQRQSQRELSRSASQDGRATIIEADFTNEAPVADSPVVSSDDSQRHHGAVIPETESEGDGGARRYEGRRRRRGGRSGEREFVESKFATAEKEPREVRPARQERDREVRRSGESEPFLLPGESLQKYGGQTSASDETSKQKIQTSSSNRPKPSTEIDLSQVTSFDGFTLPGEKLSRHKQSSSAVTGAAPETEPEANASASVSTAPEILPFVFRRRKVAKTELEEEIGEESSENGKQPHTGQQQLAHEDTLHLEPITVAPPEQTAEASATGAAHEPAEQSVAVIEPSSPHGFEPGHGDIEEVEEEYQDEEFDGIGAAEYAEDEFSFEELEEETLNEQAEDLIPAAARAASADQIVEETEEEGEKSVYAGGFTESDFTRETEEEEVVEGQPGTQPREKRGRQRQRILRGRKNVQKQTLPTISELLKEGQEVLVQIAKEPMAKKGARITSHIALPGRFLVFMPTVGHVGVSRKIGSDEERQRLKRILLSEKGDAHGGFIVRTAAAGASEEDLRADIRFLINLWSEIKHRSEGGKPPALIYHDLNLVERVLRDQVTNSFSAIWVDSEQEYERTVRFLSRFQPALVKRVKLYTKELPLYEQFGIQDEINKALKSKVWLKSGGYIVINQTEALVAIDINTGKYVGKTTRLEDTIVKTNIDAIQEIVRQIRLRDLGGIIVIDFIDMDERKNRQKVMQALEEALKQDRAPSKVLQFNDFGLVAITRKRVKQSLERTLGSTCNYCTGTGFVKSVSTVCNEVYVEMRKMAKHLERHDVLLRVNPEVVKALKANNARWLQDLEELTRKTIIVKSDPTLHQEQFDIH